MTVALAPKLADRSVADRLVATAGLMMATLMMSLDTTIANVALPHIQGSLSAAQDQITWVLTSYIVASAVMTPLTGWLAQRIGRKQLFLISIVGFVAVSVLCGMATSLPEMVIFRMLQGMAGASMMPISQAAIFDLWPQPVIPQVMAVWSVVVMVAPIMGPTLGGFLTENYSWRWVFFINVPVGALAFMAVSTAMEGDPGGQSRPFDLLGFTALVLFSGATQLMLDRGPILDWFDSPEICAEAVIALCGLYVFLMQTITSAHPFFHREILTDRNFMSCLAFSMVFSAVLFATSALLPTFMQSLLGYSALQSGMAVMPRGIGSICAFVFVPWLSQRFGPRKTMALGVSITAASLWKMGHFDLSMTAAPIKVAGFIQGFGQGLIFNPMAVLSFATLAPGHRTEAAVLSNTLRTLGGSVGIAGLQALLIRQSAAAHESLAARIIPSDAVIRWALPEIGRGGVEAVNGEVTRQAAMIGYDAAFGWLCMASLCMLPLLLIMRPPRPGETPVMQAHAD